MHTTRLARFSGTYLRWHTDAACAPGFARLYATPAGRPPLPTPWCPGQRFRVPHPSALEQSEGGWYNWPWEAGQRPSDVPAPVESARRGHPFVYVRPREDGFSRGREARTRAIIRANTRRASGLRRVIAVPLVRVSSNTTVCVACGVHSAYNWKGISGLAAAVQREAPSLLQETALPFCLRIPGLARRSWRGRCGVPHQQAQRFAAARRHRNRDGKPKRRKALPPRVSCLTGRPSRPPVRRENPACVGDPRRISKAMLWSRFTLPPTMVGGVARALTASPPHENAP